MISTLDKIKKIRNGERTLCKRCSTGHITPMGDPMTTNVFSCDHCGVTLTLTVPLKIDAEGDK